jgi:hypothetical protein
MSALASGAGRSGPTDLLNGLTGLVFACLNRYFSGVYSQCPIPPFCECSSTDTVSQSRLGLVVTPNGWRVASGCAADYLATIQHNGGITGIGDVPTDRNAEGVIHMGDAKRGFSGTSVCEVNVN